MIRCALLFVVLAASAVADDEVKTDLQTMQGKWKMAALTVNGRQQSDDYFNDLSLEIKGDKYLITYNGETASRTFKIDPAKKPKEMDITYDDGPNKGKTGHTIYAVDGDTLMICRHEQPEMERPKEFTAEAGSGRAVVTWKRVK